MKVFSDKNRESKMGQEAFKKGVRGARSMKRYIGEGLTASTIKEQEEEDKTREQLSLAEQKSFQKLSPRKRRRYVKGERGKGQPFSQNMETAAFLQRTAGRAPGMPKASGQTDTGALRTSEGSAGSTATQPGSKATGGQWGREGTPPAGIFPAGTAPAGSVTAGAARSTGAAAKTAAATGTSAVTGTASAGTLTAVRAARRSAEKFRASLQASALEKQKFAGKMERQAKEQMTLGKNKDIQKTRRAVFLLSGAGMLLLAKAARFLHSLIHTLLLGFLLLAPFFLLMVVLTVVLTLLFASALSEHPTGARIVAVARQEASVSEQNIGGGKYKDWYGMNADWCAMFVSWCADACGYIEQGVIPKSASVATIRSFYEERNLYFLRGSHTPQSGDLIFFGGGSRHIGIVAAYDAASKTVTTVEGNTGNSQTSPYHLGSRVREKTYSIADAYITGYATPDYPENASIEIPEPYGTLYTYMGWQTITAPGSRQYRLREEAGMHFDGDGFGKIEGRYVIACTSTFGQVGDYLDWELSDGTIIHTVIGDIKNQSDPGCNQWGHNEGACVIEFVVDKGTWYGTDKYPTRYHPEWNARVAFATYAGSYW